jgi:acylphosphatase
MAVVRAHVIVSGLVQGVFFRAYTKERAQELSLNGWVKNRWDGNVELVLEGEKEKVDKIVDWLYKGPPHARVDQVEVEWKEPTGEFEGFWVKY